MQQKKINYFDNEIPSNKKFGFFFALIFWIISAYTFHFFNSNLFVLFIILGLFFFISSIFKPIILYPINKLWMRFGFLLSIIVTPFVMGGIFFGIFTPIAFLIKLFGRDELQLKLQKKTTYWISRDSSVEHNSFINQF